MRSDLPTRGAYPRKILRRPRFSRRSSACTRRSNSSGVGLRSVRGVTVSRIVLAWGGRDRNRRTQRVPRPVLFCVQSEVELQDIHSGFAEDGHLTVLGMGGDQLAESLGGHPAGGGHAGHLGIDGFGAQVRVQAAARGGYRIAGDRARERGILGAEGFHIGGYAIGKLLAGGAE